MSKLRGLQGFYFVLIFPLGMTAMRKCKDACPAGLKLQHTPPLLLSATHAAGSISSPKDIVSTLIEESANYSSGGSSNIAALSPMMSFAYRMLISILFCVGGFAYLCLEKREEKNSLKVMKV